MDQTIVVKHVNEVKNIRVKISEVGDVEHEITLNCLLADGDLERLILIFRQKIPVEVTFFSPQSQMDLEVKKVVPAPEKATAKAGS